MKHYAVELFHCSHSALLIIHAQVCAFLAQEVWELLEYFTDEFFKSVTYACIMLQNKMVQILDTSQSFQAVNRRQHMSWGKNQSNKGFSRRSIDLMLTRITQPNDTVTHCCIVKIMMSGSSRMESMRSFLELAAFTHLSCKGWAGLLGPLAEVWLWKFWAWSSLITVTSVELSQLIDGTIISPSEKQKQSYILNVIPGEVETATHSMRLADKFTLPKRKILLTLEI